MTEALWTVLQKIVGQPTTYISGPVSSNMFKLGDYVESEAREISAYLKKAGLKVDLKPTIEAQVQNDEFLEGRFSEIRGEVKDKDYIEEVERYLDALRKVMQEKTSPEDFGPMYLKTLFPSIDEDLDAIKAAIGSDESDEGGAGTEDESIRTDAEPSEGEECAGAGSKDDAGGLEDGIERQHESFSDLMDIISKSTRAKDFALSVLSLNDLIVGEDVGAKLDDPVVAVPVDLDEYPDHPNAKSVLSVYLTKNYELYVDEFSTFLAEGLDDEFQEEYMEESLKIRSMDLLLGDLIDNHSSEKMEFEDFRDECFFSTEAGNSSYRVFGENVAEDIAKVLEKNGLLKIKGNIIKWKK